MREVHIRLTEAEAAAVLRSEGFTMGHGVRLSKALISADRKLRQALEGDDDE